VTEEHEDMERVEKFKKQESQSYMERREINDYGRKRFSKSKFNPFSRKADLVNLVALLRFDIEFDAMTMEERLSGMLSEDDYSICEVVVICLINFAVLWQALSDRMSRAARQPLQF